MEKSERSDNIYFLVMARSKNPAEAIQEAFEVAQALNHTSRDLPIVVKACGTEDEIAKVFHDGAVGFPNAE